MSGACPTAQRDGCADDRGHGRGRHRGAPLTSERSSVTGAASLWSPLPQVADAVLLLMLTHELGNATTGPRPR